MTKKGIFILVLTLITLVAWLGFDIYHRRQETQLPEIPTEALIELDPQLPTQVLGELEKRAKPGLPAELRF